jgi:hypothetical protein
MTRLHQDHSHADLKASTATATAKSSTTSSSSLPTQKKHKGDGSKEENSSSEHHLIPHRHLIELPSTPNELADLQKVVDSLNKVPDIVNNVTAGIQRIENVLQQLDFAVGLEETVMFFKRVVSMVSTLFEPLNVLGPIFNAIKEALETFE